MREGSGVAERKEVQDLFRAFHDGDEGAGRELLEYFLDWVYQVARDLEYRFRGNLRAEELYASGVEGLREALMRFDLSRPRGLPTFCKSRIRGAMIDEVRRIDPVPRSERLRIRRLSEAEEELTQELGRPPTQHELAVGLETPFDDPQLFRGARLSRSVRPFSELFARESDQEALLQHEDRHVELIESRVDFDTLVADLSMKERDILAFYYRDGLSMREVGEILGICESRVSQIHKNVLSRLRVKLAAKHA